MRLRRRAREGFHEPSLVPLADMLSNTVGVAVFLLIFTVLTTGGVVVPKVFPYEHPSELEPTMVLCTDGHLLPMHASEMQKAFMSRLGQPAQGTFYEWVAKFEQRRVEDSLFVLTSEVEREQTYGGSRVTDLVIVFTPRDGAGLPMGQLATPDNLLRRELAQLDARRQMIYFIVRPSGIEAFRRAREVATAAGFHVGWNPQEENEPIRFSLTGSGGVSPKPLS